MIELLTENWLIVIVSVVAAWYVIRAARNMVHYLLGLAVLIGPATVLNFLQEHTHTFAWLDKIPGV